MKNIKSILIAMTVLFSNKACSQIPHAQMPHIEIEDKASEKSILLTSMDVQVEIFGNIAKTTTKLIFSNSSNRNQEGNLVFPLPENTTVSGYAIDINGKLRTAVPITKARAVEVFESIQKQNIDPSIIEKVEGNNFRTRISPIPAKGSRTVQVSYLQQMKVNNAAYQYHLPLDYTGTVKNFKVQVQVFNASPKPQLLESPDGTFAFSENSHVFEASLDKTDFRPSKSITINLPKSENKIESFIQKNTDGSAYFYANTLLDMPLRKKVWGKNLGIIWDNSLSGLKRDHKKELDFLGKIIAQNPQIHIEVSLLNVRLEKGKSFPIQDGNWDKLKTYLENIVYDGGTDYTQLSGNASGADEYLFFSDGISSFGMSRFTSAKPIYTIAASASANFGTLKYIAYQSNGKLINLNENSAEQAFEKINTIGVQFLGIKNHSDFSEVYPMIGTEVQHDFSISGIAQNISGEMTLLFGYNGKVTLEKEIKLRNASQVFEISKIWAQQKIDFLELHTEENKTAIEEIGKEFAIVTSNTSLIVLENVSDYVKYKIQPPAELQKDYDRLAKEAFYLRKQRASGLLHRAIATAKELQTWWSKDFKPIHKKYPTPLDNPSANDSVSASLQGRIAGTASGDDIRLEESTTFNQAGAVGTPPPHPASRSRSSLAYDMKEKSETDNTPFPEIKIAKIKSDKDYIKAIEASKNPYQTYLDLRPAYEETPSFYFDIANYFFERNQKDTGLTILSAIADLGLENFELYKMLAYKLKEIQEYGTEVFLTKKILDWRPFDAQSYRDYALALEDNGSYQEALDNLYKVLINDYTIEITLRDRDITEIIVPEINNIVALHSENLDLSKIDKSILVDIPVDIRVVMNWNKDLTDIDLWVTDPNKEKCYYAHRNTAIGGRNSEDVTQGFGPEQFMLKKAIKGKYIIESNFFAERQMSISGPTTISVEIYLFYSSGKQTRKTLTFQNNNPDRGGEGIRVGEFEF